MNKDNKVDCDDGFFDWSCVDNGGGDVYYTFRGVICSQLKGGVNNMLYGKRVNLSVMYYKMIDDVIESMLDGKFSEAEYLDKSGHVHCMVQMNKYTCKKYGVSFDWVDRVVNKRVGGFDMDRLYYCMIDRAGGVDKIDWMKLYDNTKSFITNNDDILMYIAKEMLKGDIYRYFVNRFNLRVVGVMTKVMSDKTLAKRIILEWDGGRRLERMGNIVRDKRDWWRFATYGKVKGGNNERDNINDYDVLLNGRREDEVLPDVCPIDKNIVLNYTRIDFSSDNDNNIGECKRHNDIGGNGDKIWSFASIDRIDSNREYSYDNVEIISQYYNTQVKNCASISQVCKLYHYQLKNLIDKKINKVGVKVMTDDMLCKSFDDLGVYVNLIEIVHNYRKILFKEINRRDKKRSKV